MEAFLKLVADKRLKLEPLITHRFPVESARAAYDVITGKTGEPSLAVLLTYAWAESTSTTIDLGPRSRCDQQSQVALSVIGAGNFATSTLLPALKSLDGVDLVGICSSSGAHARHAAKQFNFQYCTTDQKQLIQDPLCDAVLIATRHHLHAAQVIKALQAGKHVFCEKPLCIHEAELAEILRAYTTSMRKPVLTVGFNRRFAPMALRLKSLFSDLNEPLQLNYRVNAGSLPPDHWVNDPDQGGGRIIGELCHFVDLLIFLTASIPVKVYARALRQTDLYSGDNVSVLIDFENGSQATISYVANGDRAFSKERLEVFGGGSAAVLEDFRRLELVRHGRKEIMRSRWRQDKGHKAELRAFVEAIKMGNGTPISLREIVATTLTTFCIKHGLASGEPMDVKVSKFLDSATIGEAAKSVPA
jgi:predicted dehydrogenase